MHVQWSNNPLECSVQLFELLVRCLIVVKVDSSVYLIVLFIFTCIDWLTPGIVYQATGRQNCSMHSLSHCCAC